MDVRIQGWRYENIRGGMRDVEIDFGHAPPRWVLIQMPNGTGKTTTMALFRAVLAGEPLPGSVVRNFRPDEETENGRFELRLLIDGRPVRLELRLNYQSGEATYWTTRAALTAGGVEEGRILPDELGRLITPEFTRLFVFDGEMAKQIRNVGMDRAASAVRMLYRLDKLQELERRVDRLVTEEQARVAAISSAQTPQGLRQLESRFQTAQDTVARLEAEEKRLRGRIAAAEKEQERLSVARTDRLRADQGLRDRVQQITEAQQTVEREIVELAKRTLSTLRSPAMLHPRVLARLRNLGGKMERLKLPKTMSAEFFEELAEHTECVCGRPIGAEERQAILDRAHEYLAENQISVINAMKLAVRHSEADPREVTEEVNGLRSRLRTRHQLAQQLEELQERQIESGDDELARLQSQTEALERQLEKDNDALKRLTVRDPSLQRSLGVDWKSNLPLARAQRNERQEAWHTATNTRRFLVQARRTASLIRSIEENAFERLCERVRKATNAKIATFLPSESIRVSRIHGALEIATERLAAKADLSEGQSLAVAYAFLTSLFEDAPYRLPFIVDSPAVSLDIAVRREVGELIPDLFEQMIMFVISSERSGFADAFYDRPGVQYVTLWRETEDRTAVEFGLDRFRTFQDLEPELQEKHQPALSGGGVA
ncbi:AAA family ATPase [Longimicrobium sp.]|uniref:AAA family ATPase n=1 Tax=Longimicrobium sp. TaxID=2029185 RepID=UPI002E3304A8|nr:AAA family ATPase [Longimicrobium sp.]HEX6037785.1 AAA family ATPase [Longimicrobium sp.]